MEKLIARINHNIFYDIDDAIWHPPANDLNQRKIFWDPQRTAKIMGYCKSVITGSPYIAEYARRYNSSVHVIPTSYDDLTEIYKQEKKRYNNKVPVIIWIGNIGNAHYLNIMVKAMEKVRERHEFILRIVGGHDITDIRSPALDIEYIQWSRETEVSNLIHSDIGIMPLTSTGYDQGKCSFKIIQYMSASLPVVASPVGMNNIVVSPDTGFLAAKEHDWITALDCLLENKDQRRIMGNNGYLEFCRKYSREINANTWLEVLNSD